jgi:hypothetical protein
MKRHMSLGGRGIGLGKGLVDAIVEVAGTYWLPRDNARHLPSMAGGAIAVSKLGSEADEPYYDTR